MGDKPAQASRNGHTGADRAGDNGHGSGGNNPPEYPAVVGVGASAGGLEALSRFFASMPASVPIAFGVVQHMAPDTDSHLAEILARDCGVDARQARDGDAAEAGRVYVAPPGRSLVLRQGRWRVCEQTTRPRPLTIDTLFGSLADDGDRRIAAVILSGTGTDGTLGGRAIKAATGLVIAQDPATAAHAGMPQSAIDSGSVDLVLAPEAMMERLGEHARAPVPPAADASGDVEAGLDAILGVLHERRGHDLADYKRSGLARRIGRRMTINGVESYGAYLQMLRAEPAEVDRLFDDLLIRVSRFFRDSAAFDVLARDVIPALLERGRGRLVRVWAPGCSTGEEVYSLAMLFDELAGVDNATNVQIFATDIDQSALRAARAGRYPASIEADVSVQRLHRHFHVDEGGYRVKKHLRDRVIFAEHNLVRDPPFSRLDLVSCRNLLIYLAPKLQRRVLPLFHYALNNDGFLFLGESESIDNARDLFSPHDRQHRIFQPRVTATYKSGLDELPSFLSANYGPRSTPQGASAGRATADIEAIAQRVLLRDHSPPAIVVNGYNEILVFNGATRWFLEPASGAAALDIARMARRECVTPIRLALRRAREQRKTAASGVVELPAGADRYHGRFVAVPMEEPELPTGTMLVYLEFVDGGASADAGGDDGVRNESERVAALQSELAGKDAELQAMIGELETSSEELQSSNEELQSSNEELQSTNEELQTVNSELETKVEQLAGARDDIDNFLATSAIGMVYVDERLRVQRYTQAVTAIVPLIDGDIGRPFTDIGHRLDYPRLAEDLEQVLAGDQRLDQEIRGRDGRWYLARIAPYRLSERQVRGAVLTFVDLADKQRAELLAQLSGALDQSVSMVVIMDLEGRIVHANDGFVRRAGYRGQELVGMLASDAGLVDIGDNDALSAAGRGQAWRGEVSYRGSDGVVASFAVFMAPVRTGADAPSHIVAYLDE